jgi:hypothetical protein
MQGFLIHAGYPALVLLAFLLITRADISRAERFLAGRGGWTIPAGRALPLVRSFTSLAAGFAGVPPLRFGILSLIGTAVYAAAVSSIGYAVGSAWNRVAGDLTVAGYVTAVLVAAALAAFAVRRLLELRRESRRDADAARRHRPPAALTGDKAASPATAERVQNAQADTAGIEDPFARDIPRPGVGHG